MIVERTMSPIVSHILFFAELRANCVCMMAEFVIEHDSENEFTNRTNPTEKAGRQLYLVYKNLYPSLLSPPLATIESRHVRPFYASATSRQCACSELPKLTRQITENYRIKPNQVFFRHSCQKPFGYCEKVERRAVIGV